MPKQLFKPGVCPNPAGRPKGVKDKRSKLKEILEEHAPALLEKALSMALDGNEHMLKLLLDRALPAKPRSELVNTNILSGSLFERNEAIYEAVVSGDINPKDALLLQQTLLNRINLIQAGHAEAIYSLTDII